MDLDDEIPDFLKSVQHEWQIWSHEGPPTQWDLFLSCVVFIEYISNKSVYFHLKYYGLNIGNIVHGNKLDLYACLTQLKVALEIKYNICKSTNNEICFNTYKFMYDNL